MPMVKFAGHRLAWLHRASRSHGRHGVQSFITTCISCRVACDRRDGGVSSWRGAGHENATYYVRSLMCTFIILKEIRPALLFARETFNA